MHTLPFSTLLHSSYCQFLTRTCQSTAVKQVGCYVPGVGRRALLLHAQTSQRGTGPRCHKMDTHCCQVSRCARVQPPDSPSGAPPGTWRGWAWAHNPCALSSQQLLSGNGKHRMSPGCMAVLAQEKASEQELAKNTLSHFGVSLEQSYLRVTSALTGARTSPSSPPPGFGQPPHVPSYTGLSGQCCGDLQQSYLSPQRALQSAFSLPPGTLWAIMGSQALSSAQGSPHSGHPHPLFATESKQQRYALSRGPRSCSFQGNQSKGRLQGLSAKIA